MHRHILWKNVLVITFIQFFYICNTNSPICQEKRGVDRTTFNNFFVTLKLNMEYPLNFVSFFRYSVLHVFSKYFVVMWPSWCQIWHHFYTKSLIFQECTNDNSKKNIFISHTTLYWQVLVLVMTQSCYIFWLDNLLLTSCVKQMTSVVLNLRSHETLFEELYFKKPRRLIKWTSYRNYLVQTERKSFFFRKILVLLKNETKIWIRR